MKRYGSWVFWSLAPRAASRAVGRRRERVTRSASALGEVVHHSSNRQGAPQLAARTAVAVANGALRPRGRTLDSPAVSAAAVACRRREGPQRARIAARLDVLLHVPVELGLLLGSIPLCLATARLSFTAVARSIPSRSHMRPMVPCRQPQSPRGAPSACTPGLRCGSASAARS